ncbi:MAG: hypothetical protein ACSHYA_20200 [Opitutaceae bacterium]
MSSTINLANTNDSKDFKQCHQATTIRDGVLQGYRDLLNGDVVEFKGDLKSILAS